MSPRTIGPYEVVRELGRGGMGAVYLARHQELGFEVALKVLLSGVTSSSARRERFAREVETLRRFEHSHVVEVLDAGEQGNVPWLALRYVPGRTLAERIGREGPLPVEDVLQLAEELGGALSAAHAAGVLHRDVKPDNVLCHGEDGRYLLTDFGLARDVELAESRRLSLTGTIQGTPGFWAPEQAGGGETGTWTDVYGLAATLYAALTGDPPIRGSGFLEVVAATRDARPESIRRSRGDVSTALERAVLGGLEKAPGDRPPSVEALVESVLATRAIESSRLLRRVLIASIALVLTLAALTTWVLMARRPPGPTLAGGSALPTPSSPSASASSVPTPTPAAKTAKTGATLTAAERSELEEEIRRLRAAGRNRDLVPLLRRAADAGEPVAAFNLAHLFRRGQGVPVDDAAALRWYRRAHELGFAPAAGQLGLVYLRGWLGASKDLPLARRLLQEAAAKGVPQSMSNLATMLARGLGGPVDVPNAIAWYERSAKAGNVASLVRAGDLLDQHPTPDHARSARLYEAAATGGDPEGAYRWAQALEGGRGVTRNPAAAVDWFRAAAKKRHTQALVEMGDRHRYGNGVPQNLGASVQCYQAAAKGGSARAMHEVGIAFEEGVAVPKNMESAASWVRRAARAGHPSAQLDLASRLWHGARGFLLDRVEARRWIRPARATFERRAAKHDPDAWLGLGKLLERGLDRAPDFAAAAKWYRKAAGAGNAEAMFLIAHLRYFGKGVRRDRSVAAEWMKRSAELGYVQAMERYATCLAQGVGVQRDLLAARTWMEIAAKRHNPSAAFGLGLLHDISDPLKPRDWRQAARWYLVAAKRGHIHAMIRLGGLYLGRKGERRRLAEARSWLEKARSMLVPSQTQFHKAIDENERALRALEGK